ncbi:MAG: hypothetical protein ISR98_02020 [Parcubacteria group bacterium]|nr:hypothetical protein [Parcubacteria group bacterium]
MLKQKLFKEQFILVAIIALLDFIAINFYLYWTFWWFDIVMHFLGGLWVGLIVLWFFFFSGYVYKDIDLVKRSKIFLITIASVLFVGLVWEVWEVWAKLVFINEASYFVDTPLDLIMDTLGGITAFVYAKKYLKNEK